MCFSPEISFASDFKPDFPYFLFKTLAGVTGILLYSVCCLIFIFSHAKVREKAYNVFWISHQFYIALFVLSLLHGLQRLTAAPTFWLFFVGPATVFVIDKIVSLRRGYMELDVLETELLPSSVIRLWYWWYWFLGQLMQKSTVRRWYRCWKNMCFNRYCRRVKEYKPSYYYDTCFIKNELYWRIEETIVHIRMIIYNSLHKNNTLL